MVSRPTVGDFKPSHAANSSSAPPPEGQSAARLPRLRNDPRNATVAGELDEAARRENVEVGVGPGAFSIVIGEELATSAAMTRVQTRGPVLHYMAREARAGRTAVNEPAKPR